MTTNIKHKKSAIKGKHSLVGQFQYRELGLNTYDDAIQLASGGGATAVNTDFKAGQALILNDVNV